MSSPASRPDRPEGAAETRRGDDASEGHAAPSASSEGSNVAEGSSSAREGLPSAGTSTTGQDATGAEARDESPDVSSRVTSGAGKDAADAPHAPHAPSTVRPARPPQRPPSELRPRRGAASAPDARLAPPRASRGVAAVIEWRTKISQAARDVQTAVEDASGLRVDDSAADLESLVEEERKMVRDLPRNAGAALSDARRVAGTVAGATRRTVDEVVGTAVDAARAGNRAERGSRARIRRTEARWSVATTRRVCGARRSVARRSRTPRATSRSASRARSRRAPSGAKGRPRGSPRPPRERSVSGAARRRSRARRRARARAARFGECADAGKALLEETRRKRETKASPAGPLKRKNAPERTERVLRDRERKEKEKEKEKEKASRLRETFADTAERDRKRREEKMARVAEREAARRATLETLRARESVSRREKAALAARALAEREARKEAERLAREADRRAAKEAREAEKRAELLEKESARLASMRPERRARRERARAREAERDERVRAARAARAAERARLAAKAEAERRRGDSADEKASRLETRSIAKRRSSPFAFAFASGVRSKSTKERTATNKAHSRDAPDVPCVDAQHPMLGDALGGLLAAAGVAAARRRAGGFARADAFGAAERAKAKTAKALRLEALGRLAARAGADVRADFRDATVASVTVARARDAVAGPTSGPCSVSAAAAAAETHACRRIGAPARVGPPLRLDAAWRALRRRLDSRRPIDGGDAGGDTGGDAAEEPPSPATAAAAALSPVEEAVRAAEAAAAATPAVAKYRAYRDGEEKDAEERQVSRARATKPRTNPESDDVAATPAERRDASAAGVTLVTPEVTPASTPARTPAGTPRRPAEKIDLDAVGKAADLAVLEALTPRGTPFGTPAGTPGRSRDSGTNARVFTLEEYARAVTKLEGKKEALVAALARLERRGSGVASDLEAAQDMESARATVSAGLSPRRGAYYGTDDQGDQGDRSSHSRRDSVDAVAAARLVTNGLDAFEGTAKRVESDDESDDEADDGDLQPETREARRAVARLHRECAALETKLRAREDTVDAEHSALSRRERETKLAYARKAIRHLSSSLRRRALLAWVLYLDEATRRRRLLRRAATKMRLRLASAAFESWLEYARMRRESRAERRLRELQKRAEQAEALEMEARRAKAAAAAKAAETASLVADAEAREARARREVEAMRSRGKASGKASGSASSDSES